MIDCQFNFLTRKCQAVKIDNNVFLENDNHQTYLDAAIYFFGDETPFKSKREHYNKLYA